VSERPGADGLDASADALIDELRSIVRPRLFVISGPSGVGKDTIIDRLRPRLPEFHFAVTATTRERRGGEVDGIHYHFMSGDEFLRLREAGEFLESAEVYGKNHWYGVPKARVRSALRSGRHVIVKVDVQGADSIRKLAPGAVLIFVAPPSMEELTERLVRRKADDPDVLMQRVRTASHELQRAMAFDYVVFNENDRPEQTVDTIAAIVTAETARVHQLTVEL
jgi:guanylate kinase